jgi:hypothetical protein
MASSSWRSRLAAFQLVAGLAGFWSRLPVCSLLLVEFLQNIFGDGRSEFLVEISLGT